MPLPRLDTEVVASRRPLEIGDLVGERYRVCGLLGRGGMGTVYLVEHTRLGQQHALKLLHAHLAEDLSMHQRFEREAQLVAGLQSEHVVRIFDSGSLPNGTPYFVMERLLGQDLRALLVGSTRMPLGRATHLGIDACLGLHAVHSAGLVHRDLKPENIFITRGDDGRDVCKLLDFGIARAVQTTSTAPGTLLGSARYMAPEQIGLSCAISSSTDVFSLGVTLYECIAGVPPFEADTLERLFFKIMNDAPERLESAAPGVNREFADIIHQCLAKRPEQRYPSALSLARALEPHANRARHSGVYAPRASSESTGAEITLAEAPSPQNQDGAGRGDAELAPSKRRVLARRVAVAGGLGAFLALVVSFAVRDRRVGGAIEQAGGVTNAPALVVGPRAQQTPVGGAPAGTSPNAQQPQSAAPMASHPAAAPVPAPSLRASPQATAVRSVRSVRRRGADATPPAASAATSSPTDLDQLIQERQ